MEYTFARFNVLKDFSNTALWWLLTEKSNILLNINIYKQYININDISAALLHALRFLTVL